MSNEIDEAYTGNLAGRKGECTSLKQFSPEMSEVVVDDAVNEAEVNTVKIAKGKIFIGRRGQRAWHVRREAPGTWETLFSPFANAKGRIYQLTRRLADGL